MLWTADSVEYRSVPMYAAYSGDTLIWMKPSLDYLTVEVLSAGTIVMDFSGTTAEMRVNNGGFEAIGDRTYTANAGDIIQFRGSETSYDYVSGGYRIGHGLKGGTAKFNVRGNIMSMLYPNSFEGKAFPSGSTWTFCHFFSGCTGLIEASGLTIPSSTAPYCFDNFFRECTNLVSAPLLPATSLQEGCYTAMFHKCTSLATPPVLPASRMADSCYMSMFGYCTSMVTAPVLASRELAPYCYDDMFHNCTGLVNAPALPATTLQECCYAGMFEYCTSLTTAPVLPASRSFLQSYYRMFYGCTSLSYIKCMLTSIGVNSINQWVTNVSPTGTFVKDQTMVDWPSGDNGIPSGWSVQDA